jgi:hypothetical protein
LAEGYPEEPTPPVRRHCASFLESLAWMLPCESCGYHFRRFLRSYEGGAELASRDRHELSRFVLEAHNAVARHTRPCAPPWTPEDVRVEFGSAVVFSDPPLEWTESSRLIRSLDPAGASCSCQQ